MTLAGFPNFRDTHRFEGIISPQQAVAYVRDDPRLVIPDAAIMTYGQTMQQLGVLHRGD